MSKPPYQLTKRGVKATALELHKIKSNLSLRLFEIVSHSRLLVLADGQDHRGIYSNFGSISSLVVDWLACSWYSLLLGQRVVQAIEEMHTLPKWA